AALSRAARVRAMRPNFWLLLPLLFFAAMIVVRANATLTLLNLAAVGVLLALLVFFYAADRVEHLGLVGYPTVLAVVLKHLATDQTPAVGMVGRAAARERRRLRLAAPLVRGILFAAPVLIVFTILLSSADSIFADYVGRLFRFEFLDNLPELLWR